MTASADPDAERVYLACRRLMEMVRELHRQGYERLRLHPGLAPSGLYWRCSVYAVGEDGAPVRSEELRREETPRYSSGSGMAVFGWTDAEGDTPAELAAKFVARFPAHAAAGLGADPEYARWYQDMMEKTAPLGVIYGYADYPLPGNAMSVANAPPGTTIPLPPGWTA